MTHRGPFQLRPFCDSVILWVLFIIICGITSSPCPRSRPRALSPCAEFGWGRVSFLYSSWFGAVVWICARNSVDNTGKFLLSLSGAYTDSIKAFSASRPTPPARRLEGHKELGGDRAGTADPS